MSFDADDEILQDFLVEAGEILEQLGEQLVDLEQQPENYDLLNAVFRGFHTIKGGAGFLGIEPLVGVCHRAEDVFNVLRQGKRKADAHLMDVMLRVLDVVNTMFDSIRAGDMPEPAEAGLLNALTVLADVDDEVTAGSFSKTPSSSSPIVSSSSRQESPVSNGPEEMPLQDRHPSASDAKDAEPENTTQSDSSKDEITEDEFEALLDKLHGKGAPGGLPRDARVVAPSAPKPEIPAQPTDDISDDEFEALLDQLHGKGQHAGMPTGGIERASAGQGKPQPKDRPTPSAVSAKSVDDESRTKPPAASETSVRVDTQRLDDIMNMVGELVLVRNRLSTLKAKLNDENVANAVSNLDVVTADLQLAVMKTRMQPIKKVFGRFPRVVRDLARSLKKEVDLEMRGEETDLDKNLVEALADPMVHLVRNAVDHGIESPAERVAAGKSSKGTVILSAAQEGDHIVLSIEDDGKGMDADVLRRKAVEKGMMDEEAAARLDERECFNLIFQPGFSTKSEISDVSGRGVGMDVVKTRIAQMNGSVAINSVYGKGSKIVIKLPLTLAILPTLMVVLGNQPFALPLANVVEIFNLDLKHTNVVDGQETIMVRNRALPLYYLSQWLVRGGSGREYEKGHGHVVVVNIANVQIGLVVDYLVGQEEVVIKPLGAMLQGLDGMAGATITGDGKIALILDVPGLMRKYARRSYGRK